MIAEPDSGGAGEQTWMPGGGVVARRTNRLIHSLIRAMNRQRAYRVTHRQLDRVIERVVGVGGERTKEQYRKRVVRHGPFSVEGGRYVLEEAYREDGGGEER